MSNHASVTREQQAMTSGLTPQYVTSNYRLLFPLACLLPHMCHGFSGQVTHRRVLFSASPSPKPRLLFTAEASPVPRPTSHNPLPLFQEAMSVFCPLHLVHIAFSPTATRPFFHLLCTVSVYSSSITPRGNESLRNPVCILWLQDLEKLHFISWCHKVMPSVPFCDFKVYAPSAGIFCTKQLSLHEGNFDSELGTLNFFFLLNVS